MGWVYRRKRRTPPAPKTPPLQTSKNEPSFLHPSSHLLGLGRIGGQWPIRMTSTFYSWSDLTLRLETNGCRGSSRFQSSDRGIVSFLLRVNLLTESNESFFQSLLDRVIRKDIQQNKRKQQQNIAPPPLIPIDELEIKLLANQLFAQLPKFIRLDLVPSARWSGFVTDLTVDDVGSSLGGKWGERKQ